MSEELIHLFRESHLTRARLVLFMIPGLVFLIVLVLYLSLSSYKTQKAVSNSAPLQVLGTNK